MAGEGAGGNGDAIPQIDHGNSEGKVDDFFFGEMLLQVSVHIIRGVSLRDLRYGFGPGEGGAFAVREEGSLAPSLECVEALLGFADGSGVEGMHVEAISAAVDLRGAHSDEVEELGVESALCNVFFDGEEVLEGLLIEFSVVDARLHDSPFVLGASANR